MLMTFVCIDEFHKKRFKSIDQQKKFKKHNCADVKCRRKIVEQKQKKNNSFFNK